MAHALRMARTSEASHRAFEAFFFDRLQNRLQDAGRGVDRRRGPARTPGSRPGAAALHPAGDRAPPVWRAADLGVGLCARRSWRTPPLAVGYSSKAPQTGNHFARDVGISLWVNRVKTQWPAVPLLYSSKARRSAVALVGIACGLSEAHTRRIFQARGEMTLRLAEFFPRLHQHPDKRAGVVCGVTGGGICRE